VINNSNSKKANFKRLDRLAEKLQPDFAAMADHEVDNWLVTHSARGTSIAALSTPALGQLCQRILRHWGEKYGYEKTLEIVKEVEAGVDVDTINARHFNGGAADSRVTLGDLDFDLGRLTN
jgi:hypothetical protein